MLLDNNITMIIVGSFITGSIGLGFFFVREYMKNINETQKNLVNSLLGVEKYLVRLDDKGASHTKEIARVDGRVCNMETLLSQHTEQMIQNKMELKALWRFADNMPKRASDS